MTMELFQQLEPSLMLLLFFIALFAGYIDAIAGGGGVVQVPALLLCGVSPVAALATNKVVSMVGTPSAVAPLCLRATQAISFTIWFLPAHSPLGIGYKKV